MSTATKFLFDTRFDMEAEREITPFVAEPDGLEGAGPEVEPEPEIVVPTFSEEELAAAKEEAFAAGKAEGRNEAAAGIEGKATEAMAGIVAQLEEVFRTEAKALETSARDAMHVAVAVVRKMLPGLSERNGLGEIERVVGLALEKLNEEHVVAIQVNDALKAPIEERLTALAANAGFNGRVGVVGDGDIPVGDCRVQWAKGGAARDTNELWREIDEIISRNIGAPGSEATPPGPAEEDDTRRESSQEEIEPAAVLDETEPGESQDDADPGLEHRDGEDSGS